MTRPPVSDPPDRAGPPLDLRLLADVRRVLGAAVRDIGRRVIVMPARRWPSGWLSAPDEMARPVWSMALTRTRTGRCPRPRNAIARRSA
jgi:hypothetical protein